MIRPRSIAIIATLCAWTSIVSGLTATSPAAAREPADTIIVNTEIVTMEPAHPRAEALAIRGDRIVAVGSNQDIASWAGADTRTLDLAGATIVPGFIDAHGHFLGLGNSKMILDLTTATTWADIVNQVAAAARKAKPGAWIMGRGWHQNKWHAPPSPAVEGCPVHNELSRVAPHNPVLLTHASGHMCIANANALQRGGVTAATQAPPGGQILHKANGDPTGVLRENAMALVRRCYAQDQSRRSAAEKLHDLETAVRLAAEECLRHGVTSFQDAGSSFADITLFKRRAQQHQLPVRLWVMVIEDNAALAAHLHDYRMIGCADNHLTVRAIKRLIDGALGSHGAWLLSPYDDLPSSCGLNTLVLDDLRATAQLALEHDCQLCVHAIGDRANREVLDIYQAAFQKAGHAADRRWRIEHAQHLAPIDIPRFHELGVIASMQFVHATSDGPFVVQRLGKDRAQSGAYAWKSLHDAGVVIANGTDTPVEPVDPLAGLFSAVTRRMVNGKSFYPEQCLTRLEALRCYTVNAAYAAHEESLKGSIRVGKLADLAVLSGNPMTVPADQIPKLRVLFTLVGGRVVYRAEK